MSPGEARNIMVTAFLNGIGLPDTLVALDNQTFEPPDDAQSWVRINVQHNLGEQAALGGDPGNRLFRRYGLVFIQVFVRLNDATDELDNLSYTALKIFEGVDLSGIWFRNGRIVNVPAPEEKWFQQNVVIEFQYDDIH